MLETTTTEYKSHVVPGVPIKVWQCQSSTIATMGIKNRILVECLGSRVVSVKNMIDYDLLVEAMSLCHNQYVEWQEEENVRENSK